MTATIHNMQSVRGRKQQLQTLCTGICDITQCPKLCHHFQHQEHAKTFSDTSQGKNNKHKNVHTKTTVVMDLLF